MFCPNCGHEQPKSDACTRCGIIFDKYRARALDRSAREVATEYVPNSATRGPEQLPTES